MQRMIKIELATINAINPPEEPPVKLSGRVNLGYNKASVNTDYDKGEDEDHEAGRWAVAFDRFFFEKLFQFYFSNQGFISVSDTSDVLMYTKTGVRFPIRSGFFLNLGYEWDWDN